MVGSWRASLNRNNPQPSVMRPKTSAPRPSSLVSNIMPPTYAAAAAAATSSMHHSSPYHHRSTASVVSSVSPDGLSESPSKTDKTDKLAVTPPCPHHSLAPPRGMDEAAPAGNTSGATSSYIMSDVTAPPPSCTGGKLPSTTRGGPAHVPADTSYKILSTLSLQPMKMLSSLRRVNSDSFLNRPTKSLTPFPPHSRLPFLPMPTHERGGAPLNQTTSLAFAQTVVTAVNDAAVCLLISLGHQLGLFAVLARLSPLPYPAHVIASTANLKTRPVEEWLSAMSCASIIESHVDEEQYDDDHDDVHRDDFAPRLSYVLPCEHAVWLTWGSSTNLALLCQTIPALASVERDVVRCYRRGGGLDRSTFAAYERILAFDVMQTVGMRIVSILQLRPTLMDELTAGICVICVGGAADAVYVRLARMFPRSWFTCYETSDRQANAAKKTVEESGVTNVHFKIVRRMDEMSERDSYDVALVLEGGAIRECENPVRCLAALRNALRPGRALLYIEMMTGGNVETDRQNRVAVFLYSVAAMYNLPKAIANGEVGEAVGGIWGHVNVRNALYEADFDDVAMHPLEDDSLNCVLLATTPPAR